MGKKKFLKRLVSIMLAMVMMVAMLPQLAVTANAAADSIDVYFKLPSDTTVDDWAVNAWGDNVTVTGNAENAFRPSSWGEGDTYPALLTKDGLDGWGYATLTGTVAGMQFVKKDATEYNCWKDAISQNSLTEAYFNPEDGKWYKEAACANEVLPPEGTPTKTDLTIHFQNEKNWETVYAKFGAGGSWSSIAGYEFCMNDFGGIVQANNKNDGWYSFNIKKDDAETVNGLFNCGAWEGDNQTSNFSVEITNEQMEVWITYTQGTTVAVSEQSPDGWAEGGNILELINPAASSEIKSPVIHADGSVTFNFEISEEKLAGEKPYLMGTIPETGWDTGLEMTDEDGDGVYSITLKVAPGRYQYKFRYGSTWVTDPLNTEYESGNSLLVVNGFMLSAENLAGAGDFEVTAENTEGIDTNTIEWYVTDADGISIKGNADDPTKATITTTKDAKTGYYTVSAKYKDGEDEYTAELELYYTEKAVLYEYVYKEGSQWTGQSDIYTWYNSQAGNVGAKFREVNGRYTAYITLDDTTQNFGYIIRLPGMWGASESEDREYGDRTLAVNTDDRYTKVKGGEGIEVPYILPSAKTELENGILFKWRDDDKFYNNTMDDMAGANVQVVVKSAETGQEVTADMEYNEKDELFTCQYTGIDEGTYEFYFTVDGTKYEDQYLNGTIEYKKPELDIQATVTPETVNYNENPVVSFTITDKATGEDIEAGSITADITKLGYDGQEVVFSASAKEGVLYIDRSVEAGTYEIPFTIKDAWGNETTENVKITVVDRTEDDAAWDESRIYFLLTDRFVNGDTSNDINTAPDKIEAYHGGDFKGLTSKLGYLQELGINTIWITPIVDNIEDVMNESLHQQAYHGYWAKDFTTLDEHLGDTADLDNLIDEAQKRGIKIMVDIVVNHAGYNTNDQENFAGMLRTKEDQVEGDVILGELDGLPDFKTEDEGVRKQLVAWQTAWANHTTSNGNRIAYFRVDTVKHVDHDTWQALKTSLAKVNPAFKMIGEYFGASISNTGDYLGNGQMDALLDFDFKSIASQFVNGNIEAAEAALEARNAKMTNSTTMGQFLSSHDEDGFLYSQGGDTAKMKAAAALQITAKGMPVVYYGEEINLTGPNDFGNQNNNRYDMQFDNLTDDQQAMLDHYKKLLAARALYSNVFSVGTREKIAGSNADGYLIFKRSADENVYVGINTTGTEQTVSFNVAEETLVDLYSGNDVAVNNGQATVTIPANADGGTVILAKGRELTDVIFTGPNKTNYNIGEELDLDGITVTGVYDGTVKVPISSYTVDTSAYDNSKEGTYIITVSYAGREQKYEVTVGKTADTPDLLPPGTQTPNTDTPNTEAPDTETPGTETPGTETPDTGTSGSDTEVKEVGAVISDTASGARYTVTVSDEKNGEVIYRKPADENAAKVTIPAAIRENGVVYKVTAIAANAFKNNKNVTQITIGNYVRTIGTGAFAGCTSLKTVAMGKSVTRVGTQSFYKCTNLTKVTFPAKAAIIGKQAFAGCTSLKTVVMGANITKIGKQAFYKCSKLTEITIPAKVQMIGRYALAGCSKLNSITIKTTKLTTKNVGSNAFKGIYSKAVITVPKAKLDAYTKLLKKKGISSKVTIK